MVKTPRTRHYKPNRAPVTIDLEPNAEDVAAATAAEAQTAETQPDDQTADAATSTVTTETGGIDAPSLGAEPEPLDQPAEDRIETEAAHTGEHTVPPYAFGGSGEDKSFGRATSRPSEAPPAPVAPARGGFSNLLSGLIGGLVALAIAGLLQFAGLLGSPGGSAPALDGVQAEIGALKTEIETLKAAGQGDGGAAAAGLTTALDQVKTDIAALQSAVQAGSSGDGAGVAALDAKLKQLETQLAGLANGSAGASGEEVAALTTKLAALEQTIAGLSSKIEGQAAQPRIALAISAAALKSALDRGAPFAAELETFAAISPNSPEIAGLRAYAEGGVMTRADIAKAFSAAADGMVSASEPVAEDAGFFQRLLSSASSVVKVRPVGEVAGEEPPARVARMEVAVNAGDYAKALAEYEALPEAAKAAGADIANKIKARVEVETLVDQMIAGAMKAA